MSKFRKRPVVIEAEQFDPGAEEWPFEAEMWASPVIRTGDNAYAINTLEGPYIVTPGNWIIRGIKGEFYVCKDEIFRLTYEAVEEDTRG